MPFALRAESRRHCMKNGPSERKEWQVLYPLMLTPPYVWLDWYYSPLVLTCSLPASWPPVRGPSLVDFHLIEDQQSARDYDECLWDLRVMVGVEGAGDYSRIRWWLTSTGGWGRWEDERQTRPNKPQGHYSGTLVETPSCSRRRAKGS